MPRVSDDAWDSGQWYEQYVGRWSRRVAVGFLSWLAPRAGLAWGDVGCGTGALAAAVLAQHRPATVWGIDASPDFVREAGRALADPRVRIEVGDATRLPWPTDSLDAVVSGLVLNFIPDQAAMVRELARVARPGGTVALYVWDYADGMQMIRWFWDAAAEVDPASGALDEAVRFPVCRPEPLRALFERAGLRGVDVTAIDVPTSFDGFDDFWTPFLGKTGPAPAYLASLDEERRARVRERLRARLSPAPSGRVELTARAWAVRGARASTSP
jgi:SAM-dependent methyltransferase